MLERTSVLNFAHTRNSPHVWTFGSTSLVDHWGEGCQDKISASAKILTRGFVFFVSHRLLLHVPLLLCLHPLVLLAQDFHNNNKALYIIHSICSLKALCGPHKKLLRFYCCYFWNITTHNTQSTQSTTHNLCTKQLKPTKEICSNTQLYC